jgi:hypothetical protein
VPAPSSQSGLNGSSDAFVPGGSVVRYISGPALFLGAGEGWQGNFFSNMNKDTWMYEPSVLVNEDGGFVILQHPHPYLSAIYQWNYFLGAPMPWVAK